MNFEAYLISKKIDSEAFKQAEASLWSSWQMEFEQLHPNSFTAQKLYLINPIRRKYPLKVEIKPVEIKTEIKQPETSQPQTSSLKPETSHVEPGALNVEPGVKPPAKPSVPRPVFKQPKPKIN